MPQEDEDLDKAGTTVLFPVVLLCRQAQHHSFSTQIMVCYLDADVLSLFNIQRSLQDTFS